MVVVIGFEVQMCSEIKKEEETEKLRKEEEKKIKRRQSEFVNFEDVVRG